MPLGDDRNLGQAEPDALIGTQVGSFVILRLLGEGGMGKVYVAEHAILKIRRVVKVLSPLLTQNVWLVRRFVNEARAVAKLPHRNLIQVHDVGQLASGAWFMVLDYLDGDPLSHYMATHDGPMPAHAIVHIVCEIANGLQVAHDHQIVHRNLKPDNVFLVVRDGDPYHAVVLDFGVAQLGDDPAVESETRSGAVIGTPMYLPPEQLRGAKVTSSADVFALGVIAYQMSTGGWFPYQDGESRATYGKLPATELYHRQTTRPPVDLRDRVPGLSSAWASAIHAAIHPDPAERPASARAFALRLAEAMAPTGLAPDGLAIVRTYARELVDTRGTGGLGGLVGVGNLAGRGGFPGGDGLAGAGGLVGASLIEGEGMTRVPLPSATPVPVAGPRYQLDEKIGSGGMAEVFLGTMTGVEGFARRVAVKRVLAGLSQMPMFATMFVAEAQIASQMVHPNIVSVLDFSRDSEGRLFLVMEYVDGKDLARLIESGPIPPSLALFIVVEMLRGLGYAHDRPDPASGTRGVVHRDVSPQNLLISYEGAVKLSDFGLAKARAASQDVCSGTVRGKLSYMSPEQVSGQMLDGRTDLYAAGVMLWEMLTHQRLFVGTAKEVMGQVIYKNIAAPGTIRSGVPVDLAAITMKLLARDRNDRYPRAEAAIDALLACDDAPRDGCGELASLLAARFPRGEEGRAPRKSGPPTMAQRPEHIPVPVPVPVPVPAQPDTAASVSEDLPAPRPRRGIFAATLSGVVLGSVAAAVVIARGEVALSGTTDPRPVPGASPAVRAVASADTGSAVARTGELAILVAPSARIWLDGKPSGPTPFRAVLPAGQYRVRLANDDLGKDESTIITVEPGQTVTLERSW